MMNNTSLKTTSLFKIDTYIDSLVKKIELLSYEKKLNMEK